MKYAFISGGASGLAQASIAELIKKDYVVFAGDIAYSEPKQVDNVHYIPLDITKEESIRAAKEYVLSKTDHLNLIANFAGVVILGSLVELPPNTLDKIISINLLGTYKVNNIFFDMLDQNDGRIINISSEYAKICGIPFHGYYGISKHAIELYNDSLRRELLGSKIKVISIRPGAFKTKMQAGVENQFADVVNNTKLYKEPLTKMSKLMTAELVKAKPATIFAKTFIKAAISAHPRRVYKINNSFKMKMLSALPAALQDAAFKSFLK